MHLTLVELDKVYEFSISFLFACTIPYAFLVSSLDPKTAVAAPLCLSLVAFIFLLHPPRAQLTLFAISIEFAILNVVLVVRNFPDYLRFDTAIPIAIGSYGTSNFLLVALMTIRGLSLEDMGIMGRINLKIGAAWDRWFLLGGERQSAVCSPPNYDEGSQASKS